MNGEFNKYTDTPCGRALAGCEAGLGRPLEYGEMADFLLDNFMQIADSREAHEIRDSVLVVFGRTTIGLYTGKICSATIEPELLAPSVPIHEEEKETIA
jgi:hypothetical protein